MVLSPFMCGAFSEAVVVLGVLSQLCVVIFNCVVQTQLISREIAITREQRSGMDFHN